MSLKFYKFFHNGLRFYGQGVREDHVRLSVEAKIGLEQGTLRPGTDDLSVQEIKKITSHYYHLGSVARALQIRKRLKGNIKKLSIGFFRSSSALSDEEFERRFCSIFNIDYEEFKNPDLEYFNDKYSRGANDITSINQLTLGQLLKKYSYDRIAAKTHKQIKRVEYTKKVIADGMQYDPVNVPVATLSRIDEMKALVLQLTSRDYRVFADNIDRDSELQKLEAGYNKSVSFLESVTGKESPKEIEKHRQRVSELPDQIAAMKAEIGWYNNIYHNTGYLVNFNNNYEYKNYDEVKAAFQEIYEKVRHKIIMHGYQYIPIREGSQISMIEYLDSFWIDVDHNNNIRLPEEEKKDE